MVNWTLPSSFRLGESEYLMSSAVNSSLAAGPLGLAVTVGTRPGALAVGEGDWVGVGTSVLVAIGVTVGKGALGGCVEKGEGETWRGGEKSCSSSIPLIFPSRLALSVRSGQDSGLF